MNADAQRMGAKMAAAGPTVTAMTADDVAFARNTLTFTQVRHLAAKVLDDTDIFMPNGQAKRHGLCRPFVPLPDVYIRPTNRGFLDTNKDIAVANGGHWYVGQPKAFAVFFFY